eukprot:CAMPEP_0180110212 /NCGR_PEP_ID=MMETSP0985-20121206/34905_1 /TAXON_ID=483367 /ORGANISM="non described non described, Strain CCMP 2436" /LENGTH=190 /DNA_ID=CAMNT_0022048187 /DNA_START=467 /DNA_END=1039 /DNA_ORIENTATION=+
MTQASKTARAESESTPRTPTPPHSGSRSLAPSLAPALPCSGEEKSLAAAVEEDEHEEGAAAQETSQHNRLEREQTRLAVLLQVVVVRPGEAGVHAEERSDRGVDAHAQSSDREQQVQLDELVAMRVKLDLHIVLRVGDVLSQFVQLFGGTVDSIMFSRSSTTSLSPACVKALFVSRLGERRGVPTLPFWG